MPGFKWLWSLGIIFPESQPRSRPGNYQQADWVLSIMESDFLIASCPGRRASWHLHRHNWSDKPEAGAGMGVRGWRGDGENAGWVLL